MRLSAPNKDLIFRGNLVWLLVAQAICILPLLIRLPVWIWSVWLFAIFWRIQIHRAQWHFPSFWLKLILGLGSAFGIYFTYQGAIGVEPMIGFLVCSFILKVTEMRTKKDALIVLFIGFVAVAAQFLFAQSILAGAYGLFSLFVLLSAWQAAFISRRLSIKNHLQRGALLLGQSLPFMLILFVVMPRLGPLWSVPMPQGQGKTGFSETLQLGDIGELVKSPAVAFRVDFSSEAPPTSDMYWRGLALDMFDGRTWSSAPTQGGRGSHWVQSKAEAEFQYSVIMEPHHYRWLFSLGYPVTAESSQLKLRRNQQNLLLSLSEVDRKAEYSVGSNRLNSMDDSDISDAQRDRLTQLPELGNPRARELASQWRGQGFSSVELVNKALRHFSHNFSYTLQPPLLGANAIDEFLFDSQRGFCEHFASSFVFLMRASGVPARVMLGYQGGELIGGLGVSGSYYVVRQSDAHAWAEVWLGEQGWQTVDPTAAVAPARINTGLEDALTSDEKHLLGSGGWTRQVFSAVYQRFDALEHSWSRWVLNYDSDSQQGIFERLLGNASPWRIAAAFTGLCGIIFVGLAVLFLVSKKIQLKTEEYKLILPILQRLKRRGIERHANETLGQVAARISSSQPELARSLRQLDHWYAQAVYANDAAAVPHLREAVKATQMRLRKRASYSVRPKSPTAG